MPAKSLQMQMPLKTNTVIYNTLESLPVIIKNVQWHKGEFVLFFQGKQIHSEEENGGYACTVYL